MVPELPGQARRVEAAASGLYSAGHIDDGRYFNRLTDHLRMRVVERPTWFSTSTAHQPCPRSALLVPHVLMQCHSQPV